MDFFDFIIEPPNFPRFCQKFKFFRFFKNCLNLKFFFLMSKRVSILNSLQKSQNISNFLRLDTNIVTGWDHSGNFVNFHRGQGKIVGEKLFREPSFYRTIKCQNRRNTRCLICSSMFHHFARFLSQKVSEKSLEKMLENVINPTKLFIGSLFEKNSLN